MKGKFTRFPPNTFEIALRGPKYIYIMRLRKNKNKINKTEGKTIDPLAQFSRPRARFDFRFSDFSVKRIPRRNTGG